MNEISLEQARDLLAEQTQDIAELLQHYGMKIVLAESCTGGMIAASLAGVPGISEYLCGSLVTYRESTKTAWLGIEPEILRDPGAVSEPVAIEMAIRALDITPEADLALSITGHLGPNAPRTQDGLIFTSVALRQETGEELAVFCSEQRLNVPHPAVENPRLWRQIAASHSALKMVRSLLQERETNEKPTTRGPSEKSKDSHILRSIKGEKSNGNHRTKQSRKRTKK